MNVKEKGMMGNESRCLECEEECREEVMKQVSESEPVVCGAEVAGLVNGLMIRTTRRM